MVAPRALRRHQHEDEIDRSPSSESKSTGFSRRAKGRRAASGPRIAVRNGDVRRRYRSSPAARAAAASKNDARLQAGNDAACSEMPPGSAFLFTGRSPGMMPCRRAFQSTACCVCPSHALLRSPVQNARQSLFDALLYAAFADIDSIRSSRRPLVENVDPLRSPLRNTKLASLPVPSLDRNLQADPVEPVHFRPRSGEAAPYIV